MELPLIETLRCRRVILASGSPRRRQLLASLDIPFDVDTDFTVDEHYPASIEALEVAPFLSMKKAEAYFAQRLITPETTVITSDTVVVSGSEVLGKPRDEDDARRMLRELSGHTHTVVTGVTVSDLRERLVRKAETKVTFASLSETEIDYYVEHYHPLDKAGAYGIQEWIGAVGVSRIEGSYYNVMGLPLHLLYTMLRDLYA